MNSAKKIIINTILCSIMVSSSPTYSNFSDIKSWVMQQIELLRKPICYFATAVGGGLFAWWYYTKIGLKNKQSLINGINNSQSTNPIATDDSDFCTDTRQNGDTVFKHKQKGYRLEMPFSGDLDRMKNNPYFCRAVALLNDASGLEGKTFNIEKIGGGQFEYINSLSRGNFPNYSLRDICRLTQILALKDAQDGCTREVDVQKTANNIKKVLETYKIHLMPTQESFSKCIELLVQEMDNSQSILSNSQVVHGFKVLVGNEQKNNDSVLPKIVIYLHPGKDQAAKVLGALKTLFEKEGVTGTGEKPRFNKQVTDLIWYAQDQGAYKDSMNNFKGAFTDNLEIYAGGVYDFIAKTNFQYTNLYPENILAQIIATIPEEERIKDFSLPLEAGDCQ